jgi:hypothetical protein
MKINTLVFAVFLAYLEPGVSVAGTATAALTWVAPTRNTDGSPLTGAMSYNIYQGGKGAGKALVSSKVAALAYTADLAKGNCFEVSSVEGGDEGPHSAEICTGVTFPAAPTGLTVVVHFT